MSDHITSQGDMHDISLLLSSWIHNGFKVYHLLWEAEKKASSLGAAIVAHRSTVPTPNPATSLAVKPSIA